MDGSEDRTLPGIREIFPGMSASKSLIESIRFMFTPPDHFPIPSSQPAARSIDHGTEDHTSTVRRLN